MYSKIMLNKKLISVDDYYNIGHKVVSSKKNDVLDIVEPKEKN